MSRMNPNGSTRGIRNDPELQIGYGLEYSESGGQRQPDEFRFAPLFDRHNRAGCFKDNILSGGAKHQFSNL
jgi:hypothetical protein